MLTEVLLNCVCMSIQYFAMKAVYYKTATPTTSILNT